MVVEDDDEPEPTEINEVPEEALDYEIYEDEEEWDGTLAPNADVDCTVTFPGFEDKQLPVGEELTMLIGVTNNGKEGLNISAVGAYLHSPYDFDYYIQNFTAKRFSDFLPPTAQYTLEYKFTGDAKLEALDYHFSAFIIINGTSRIYKQVPINGTVTLKAAGTSFLMDLASVTSTLVILGGVGFGLYTIFMGGKAPKKTKAAPVQKKEEVDSDNDDWDTDVHVPSAKSRAVGAKKGKKAKKAD